jgi:hypothetical protein
LGLLRREHTVDKEAVGRELAGLHFPEQRLHRVAALAAAAATAIWVQRW